jgi:SAM-dependent methyltransferase
MDDRLEITRQTYQRYASRFARNHWSADLSRGYQAFGARLERGAHILEIGCGPGRDIAGLRAIGFQVTGVDLSLAMLGEARERVGGDLLAGDMLHLPMNTQFDGAWLAASLLHIPKKQAPAVLNEVGRLLRRDGLMYVSLKSGQGEEWQGNREGQRFFAYYEMPELEAVIEATGFAVIESWDERIAATTWLSVVGQKSEVFNG